MAMAVVLMVCGGVLIRSFTKIVNRDPGVAVDLAGRGLVLTAIGGTIGLAGALAAGRLLSGLLFDTAAADPLTIGAVAVLLPAMTLAACAVPARRAARVDAVAMLRAE